MEKPLLEIEVHPRKSGGSSAQQVRKNQMVPAIVYGPGQKPFALALDLRSAEKYSKKEYENKIFTFKSTDKSLNSLRVLKKAISYHKLTRKPLHIDFLSLDMTKKVRVNVKINFTGKAKGVKESGGVFSVIRRTIEVECLPMEIPEFFSIDISSLDINQNFHVADLNLPENIKLITPAKASLCGVSEITEEEEKPATEQQAKEGETATEGEAKPAAGDKKPEGGDPAPTKEAKEGGGSAKK